MTSDPISRHEHPDHSILSRSNEQLAIAALADVQIASLDHRTHRLVDELTECHVAASPIGLAYEELNLLDRRHRLRDAVVGLLQRGEIGGKEATALDIAKHELASQRGDAPVVRESARHGLTLVVIVDGHRIGELVLPSPVEYVRWQREQLVERSAGPRHPVLVVALALHPAVVPAVANDV